MKETQLFTATIDTMERTRTARAFGIDLHPSPAGRAADVSMTALIAIFLFSDFFYGGQDIGLYFFGAVTCGVFVYSANYIGKLGLPFTGGDDFNGHNLPFGHFDWLKRSEYTVFKNGLNNLGHAITTLLNCFALFYHGNKFLSKIANTGADINGDGKLRLPEMICILGNSGTPSTML